MTDDPLTTDGTRASGITIDREHRTLHVARTYPVPIERVWHAWTDPVAIAAWWGPHEWTTVVRAMDVRPGGEWRYELGPDDGSVEPSHSIATYRRVEPNALLAYVDAFADASWTPTVDAGWDTEVRFTDAAGGTAVDIVTVFPDESEMRRAIELGMAEGYAEALERLSGTLER